ncbi:MAG: hypothetical protein QM308_01840 [Bacillota bacterium]|nr:hypothetical protein [Bacillota bacterium]
MKKMIARAAGLILLTLLFLTAALAEQAGAAGLPSPVFESTAEEAMKVSGTHGANLFYDDSADIRYSYIKGGEGPVIFQVKFVWEGSDCTIRVFKGAQMEDLSGMHYPWDKDIRVMAGVWQARAMLSEDEAGVVMWYDARNGLVYNIAMTGEVTLFKLMKLAMVNAEGEGEQGLTGLPNPVHEATEEEAMKASGTLGAKLPDGAEDPVYSYIDGHEGPVVFQVKFVWEGAECTVRVFKGAQLADLSGMYYPWEQEEEVMIGAHPGRVACNEDVLGVVMWHDAEKGLVYNASMSGNATKDRLMSLALANAE